MGILIALIIALAALVTIVLIALARRRREDDDPMFIPGMRNVRTRNTANADGIARTASFARVSQGLFLSQGLFVVLTAILLATTVAFAPGVALASTGDPGTEQIATTNQTRTNHSNVDPATTSTGSFQSKSASSASVSAKSSKSAVSTSASSATKSTASGVSGANSASRASSNAAAASSQASSSSDESLSTRIASADEIARLTYRNKLAHKSSSYSASSCAVSSSTSTAATKNTSSNEASKKVATKSAASNMLGAPASATPQGLAAASVDTAAITSTTTSDTLVLASGATTDSVDGGTVLPTDSSGLTVSTFYTSYTNTDRGLFPQDPSVPDTNTPNSTIYGSLIAENPRLRPSEEEVSASLDIPDDSIIPAQIDEPSTGSDASVKITYQPDVGGTVSNKLDMIDAHTGMKLDASGKPTGESISGVVATPGIGYHFVGWMLEDPNTLDENGDAALILVTDQALLDADTIKAHAYSSISGTYVPVKFIPVFKCNKYVLSYNINGGVLEQGAQGIDPISTTYGANDLLSSTQVPAKENCKFLCWNTDASGKGVAIREGEELSADTLRAMVLETAGNDKNGTEFTLYAQWHNPDAPPVLIDTITPEEPSRPGNSAISPSTKPGQVNNSVSGSNQASLDQSAPPRPNITSSGLPAPAAEAVEVANDEDSLPEVLEIIASIGDLIPLPPVIEAAPSPEEFVTISAHALVGLGEAGDGLGIANVTPAEVTQAVGTVAAASGVVALITGITGAVSTFVVRRRLARDIESNRF